MGNPPVYIVMLRCPNKKPDEKRTDPLFEFGSFGCTGCHRTTLMNPKNIDALRGARLAFVQGGRSGLRLVYLTPPVVPRAFEDRTEARWTPAEMPFRYADAPVLVCNAKEGHFPALERFAGTASRTTVVGGFSSLFRSRRRALEEPFASELVRTYDRMRAEALPGAIARTYDEALPYAPPLIDRRRVATYEALLKRLSTERGSSISRTVTQPRSSGQSCS